ncbi:MAG: hypothetical protein SFT92_01720 [Rickettsiales bacterium]|nr:hypothetical protein [Rickettsiales bacterium]
MAKSSSKAEKTTGLPQEERNQLLAIISDGDLEFFKDQDEVLARADDTDRYMIMNRAVGHGDLAILNYLVNERQWPLQNPADQDKGSVLMDALTSESTETYLWAVDAYIRAGDPSICANSTDLAQELLRHATNIRDVGGISRDEMESFKTMMSESVRLYEGIGKKSGKTDWANEEIHRFYREVIASAALAVAPEFIDAVLDLEARRDPGANMIKNIDGYIKEVRETTDMLQYMDDETAQATRESAVAILQRKKVKLLLAQPKSDENTQELITCLEHIHKHGVKPNGVEGSNTNLFRVLKLSNDEKSALLPVLIKLKETSPRYLKELADYAFSSERPGRVV